MNPIERVIRGAKRRFIDAPRGMGRQIDKDVLDKEYATGNWDHFFSFDELPRQLVLGGAIWQYHPGGSVLDLGCGSGRLAQLCQPYGFSRYVGADISSAGIAKAKELGLEGVEFLEADFDTWRPEEKFDAISFNECIGYARDPGATLAAFLPSLKPGGHFFISHHRHGNTAAQWRRMEAVAPAVGTTSVVGAKGNIWDIKVLEPVG
jgi:SAM-dependent methyltransferase